MDAEAVVEAVQGVVARARTLEEALESTTRVVHESSQKYDWTGIYLMDGAHELVLSRYVGAPSPHTRIPLGEGICGAAASQKGTIIVPDVRADPRYLACSIETRSEIVVPILHGDAVVGEIDIDSHTPHAFDETDRRMLEQVADLLAPRIARAVVTP
ncbi:MAG: GAF domain-containing protein [Acidobacteriota bacterium]